MVARSGWMILGWMALTAPLATGALADDKGPGHMHMQMPKAEPAPSSVRITSQELHASPGGVPRGWKFTLPAGDAKAGRETYVRFECFKCHAVKGEPFPAVTKTATDVGPELTGMGGGMHPAEYFAESIMNPNAVILDEPGYTGPDGTTRMPNYLDSMTLRELVNVVAYIYSLKADIPHGAPAHGHGTAAPGPMKMPAPSGHGTGSHGR